jgi:hypothetical protein
MQIAHLDDADLLCYDDGQARGKALGRAQTHLTVCPWCAQRLGEWAALGKLVRDTQPAGESFSSAGEFWTRLAARLEPRVRTWPALAFLPPVLLGALGLLIQSLVWLLWLCYDLTGLGALPSVGRSFSERLPSWLAHPYLQPIYERVGWSPGEGVRRLTQAWAGLGQASQDGVMFGMALLVLGALLAIVVTLCASWVMCWSEPAQMEQRRS